MPIEIEDDHYADTIAHEGWHKTHMKAYAEKFAAAQSATRSCAFYNFFGLNKVDVDQADCDKTARALEERLKGGVLEVFDDFHQLLYSDSGYSHSRDNTDLMRPWGEQLLNTINSDTVKDWSCSDMSGFYWFW